LHRAFDFSRDHLVWDVAINKLPELKTQITQILGEEETP
jgi:uncharacterized protein with HEPN domain